MRDAYEMALRQQEKQFRKEREELVDQLRAQIEANEDMRKRFVALSQSQQRRSNEDKENRRNSVKRERSMQRKNERMVQEMQKRHNLEKEIWISTLEEAKRQDENRQRHLHALAAKCEELDD